MKPLKWELWKHEWRKYMGLVEHKVDSERGEGGVEIVSLIDVTSLVFWNIEHFS